MSPHTRTLFSAQPENVGLYRRDERDAAGVVLELASVEAGALRVRAEEGAGAGVRRHFTVLLLGPGRDRDRPHDMTQGMWTALATGLLDDDIGEAARPTC